MPGPPPKPAGQRRRTNAPMANMTNLPAEGRQGPPPKWPRTKAPTKAQAIIWERIWRTPQAVAWELFSIDIVICRYAQLLQATEDPTTCTASLLGEVRQLEDRLGISPMSMLRLRWQIVEPEDAQVVNEGQVAAKRRLRAVDLPDAPA